MSQKQHHNDDDNQTKNGMVRGLQNRHVQLIAIAGTIGTGLFLGAGRSISLTGPSIILVYMLTGVFMYFMMRAIGEMLYMDPDQHTFINFITKYLGKGWGFFLRVVLLGIVGISWYGRNYSRCELCAVLVSKLACLANSDCLPIYLEFGKFDCG